MPGKRLSRILEYASQLLDLKLIASLSGVDGFDVTLEQGTKPGNYLGLNNQLNAVVTTVPYRWRMHVILTDGIFGIGFQPSLEPGYNLKVNDNELLLEKL